MLSLYLPGTSVLHRAPVWLKLLTMALIGLAVMVAPSPVFAAVVLGCVLGSYAVAAVPLATLWRLTRMVLLLVVVIVACQWFFSSWQLAVLVGLRLLCLVTAANLLTLTTRTSDLIAAVETLLAPLARFGLRPERVGIAVALTMRFIPVLSEQGRRVREAQAARGVTARTTFVVPLIISTLRMADGVGEALEARGWE